jgi:DNA-binding CsgD family transcriptional regulator
MRVGDTPWGTLTLWRRDGRPSFTPQEADLVASVCEPIGDAVRFHSRPIETSADRPIPRDRPGVLVFDTDGGLVSADAQAETWLDELPPEKGVPTPLGLDVPLWLVVTVFRAAANTLGHGDGTARARVRSRRGQWLVCHASAVRTAGDRPGNIVLVVEPAQPAQIAPIIVDAYGLTEREQQITHLIARGDGTAEIAGTLYLSPHTVRDYIKTIFRKVEVNSRGELVAKLFAEHFEPAHRASRRDSRE